jgi:hypothetical protein
MARSRKRVWGKSFLNKKHSHGQIVKEQVVDEVIESLLASVFESTAYIASLNKSGYHSVQMRVFYDAIMEWTLGLIPSDLSSPVSFSSSSKITCTHTIDVLQALFDISPSSFKRVILENLILLIRANNTNGDILAN